MFIKKKSEGSIVLEASLILPLFLTFLIILIAFVQISMVEIALDNTVSEAVKQVSTHFYPVDILYNQFNNSNFGKQVYKLVDTAKEERYKVIQAEELLKEYDYLFPDEVKALLNVRESLEEGLVDVYDEVLSNAFFPIVAHYADDNIIKPENFYVTKVTLPNLKDRNQSYFGIEVRYDLPLKVPFFDRVITFKKQAYERVWVGDSIIDSSGSDNSEGDSDNKDDSDEDGSDDEGNNEDDDEDDQRSLIIDSLNSPVQRGRNLRIIVRGPPNETATVTIYYQSGFVKDKRYSFDSDGWFTGDIKIGGHANEGIYLAVVKSGDLQDSRNFEVLSKDNYNKYYDLKRSMIFSKKYDD